MITAPPDCYRCFLFLYCNIQSDIFCTILPTLLTTLNRKLSVRYNPETDTIDVLADGEWMQAVKAGLQALDLLLLNYTNVNNFTHTTGANVWNVTGGSVYAGYHTGTSTSDNFDATPYNTLVLDVDYIQPGGNGDTNITIDLLDASGNVLKTITKLTNPSAGATKNTALTVDISGINSKAKIRLTSAAWSYSSMIATFNDFKLIK